MAKVALGCLFPARSPQTVVRNATISPQRAGQQFPKDWYDINELTELTPAPAKELAARTAKNAVYVIRLSLDGL